jgi:hypothetical protein
MLYLAYRIRSNTSHIGVSSLHHSPESIKLLTLAPYIKGRDKYSFSESFTGLAVSNNSTAILIAANMLLHQYTVQKLAQKCTNMKII